MDTQSQPRLLMKILIGVAWLDGEIQPQERQYLAKVAQTHHLEQDTQIDSLLTGNLKVTATDCEQWIQDYLGTRSIYDDDLLIEAISGLIYSDGDVATAEAKLLIDIQSEPTAISSPTPPLIAKIQRLYQNWLHKV
ncbi:TerB family tellurite resistance protein [Chamaesiphon sp.]|uniref:tellurite resistance TerB family protein n=1 Tax=Chamaesiphon sp. TaxID=2814140 RepID=UPI00359374A2